MLSIDEPAVSRAEPGRAAATCRCGLGRHAKKESGAAADREVVDARASVKSWAVPPTRSAGCSKRDRPPKRWVTECAAASGAAKLSTAAAAEQRRPRATARACGRNAI